MKTRFGIAGLIAVLLFTLAAASDAAILYPAPVFRWAKDTGAPAAGWKVYTCESGMACGPSAGAYNKDTYADIDQTATNTNPVILNSRGEADIYWNGKYKIVVTDETGLVKDTVDDYGNDPADAETSDAGNAIGNGSFEADTDGNGIPDGWAVTQYGTVSRVTSDQRHGEYAMSFVSTGSGGGVAAAQDYIAVQPGRGYLLSWSMKSTVADVRNVVEAVWYTGAKGLVSTTTPYDNSATNPTAWGERQVTLTPPSTARFVKITITGAHPSDATQGTTWFDDVRMVVAWAGVTSASGKTVTFNVGSLTADRTATFPDAAGTVMLAGNAVIADISNFPTVGSNGSKILKVNSAGTGYELKAVPVFRAHKNGAQSINASTTTKVQMDTETDDPNSNYNPSTYRFTPTVAGYYDITAAVNFINLATGKTGYTYLYKNGALVTVGSAQSSGATSTFTPVADLLYANGSTDYFELYCQHDDTAARSISGNSNYPWYATLARPD